MDLYAINQGIFMKISENPKTECFKLVHSNKYADLIIFN